MLQFDEFLIIRYPFHRRFLFAPLESPKFVLHSYQTLDTYTILKTQSRFHPLGSEKEGLAASLEVKGIVMMASG